MSPRRTRRRADDDGAERPLVTGSIAVTEEHPDGEWVVRRLAGDGSEKTYRCPGCDHEVRPGTPHVVAWRPGDEAGRRHWHTPCWNARDRRRAR